nr:hypothetical protein [Pantoea sp. 201603H]
MEHSTISIPNVVEESFNADVTELFNLVTTIANWVELHPLTSAMYGPDIKKSLTHGDVAIEQISYPGSSHPINVVWLVTGYEKNKLWECKSLYFGGRDESMTIRYDFLAQGDHTIFTRTSTALFEKDKVSQKTLDSAKDKSFHMIYFDNVRKKLLA